MNKSNKGFTLIELLATIAILAVVLSIVGYGVFNVIDSVREKSYKVTINNIQSEANNYVMEEIAKTKWVDSELYYNSEIQCVTVQNLIDSGYFKSDILDSSVSSNRNVLSTDNILLVRDKDSKTVIMSKLLYEDDYVPLCDGFNTVGNIFFISDSKWSKNKDIDIKYNLYNEEYVNLSDYRYDYMYEVSGTIIKDKISVFDYYEENEMINVNQNGILYANIKDTKGYVYASNHLIVNKIDNEGPVIDFGNDGSLDWQKSLSSSINVYDYGSGIDQNTFKYIISIDKNANPIYYFENGAVVSMSNENGYYYIIAYACDKLGNCTTKVSNQFKVDNVKPVITLGTNGNSNWSKNASSKVSVSDNLSGVDNNSLKYLYSKNDSGTANISFVNSEIVELEGATGEYYLITKACDNAGNCASLVSNVFKLDNTAPNIDFIKDDSKWSKVASSQINVSDSDSGVDNNSLKYIFSLNENDVPNISFVNNSLVSSVFGTNVKYLIVYACDKLGNCARSSVTDFKIDYTPPIIKFSNNGNDSWVKSASSKITVTDDGIGVDNDSLKYGFVLSSSDEPTKVFKNKTTVNINGVSGEYYLVAYACDLANNCITEVSKPFKLDNNKPVIDIYNNGNSNFSKSARSKVLVTDSDSGVDNDSLKYIFSKDHGADANTSFNNGNILEKSGATGEYYLIISACDNAGNCADEVSYIFKLDNTGPTIKFGTNGTSKWVKNASSKITATDSDSGVDKDSLRYIFSLKSNDNAINDFSNNEVVSITKVDGEYYLIAHACDMVGNCTNLQSNVFKLDNTPPVVSCNSTAAYYEQRYEDGTIKRIEAGDYRQDYLLNSSYYISYDKECSAFYYKEFKKSNATLTDCGALFLVSDNSNSFGNKYCGIGYFDDDGNTEGKTKDGDDCRWKATSCNCVKGYCSAVYSYTVYDEAGNSASNVFTMYNMYKDSPSLRNTYCNANGGASKKEYICIEDGDDDKEGPEITFSNDGNSSYSTRASSKITVTDSGVGVDTSTLRYIFSKDKNSTPIDSFVNKQEVYSLSSLDGDYYLIAYACDYFENCTRKVSKVFRLDNTAPEIEFSQDGNSSYSRVASSKITVTDSGVGEDISSFKYIYSLHISTSLTKTYSNGDVVSISSGTGEYYLMAKACDKLNNCDTKVSKIFRLDNTAPSITLNPNGDNVARKTISSNINVYDSDVGLNDSSLKYIYSTYENASPNISFSSGMTVSKSNDTGSFYLIVSACDRLDNCTIEVSDPFVLRNSGPKITFSQDGSSSWVRNASSGINVTSDGSTIDSSSLKYVFSMNSSATPNLSFSNNEIVSIPSGNGEYYLIAYACDNLGNCTREISNSFKLDNTGPEIIFSQDGNNNYSKSASSAVNVSDNLSGVDGNSLKYIYSTNQNDSLSNSFTNGSELKKLSGTGEYYLIVNACDNLGNCTDRVSNVFKLDNTVPEITFSQNGTSKWVKSASSYISVRDYDVGLDNSSLKYTVSMSNVAKPDLDFINDQEVEISSLDGYYYLVVKACDLLGNCIAKSSNSFKLDNTPPVIHCNNSVLEIRQWKKEFGNIVSNVPAGSIDYLPIDTGGHDSCSASSILKMYKGYVLANRNSILYASDNRRLTSVSYVDKVFTGSGKDNNGSFTPWNTFGVGRWEFTLTARDEAGNQAEGVFNITIWYEDL